MLAVINDNSTQVIRRGHHDGLDIGGFVLLLHVLHHPPVVHVPGVTDRAGEGREGGPGAVVAVHVENTVALALEAGAAVPADVLAHGAYFLALQMMEIIRLSKRPLHRITRNNCSTVLEILIKSLSRFGGGCQRI